MQSMPIIRCLGAYSTANRKILLLPMTTPFQKLKSKYIVAKSSLGITEDAPLENWRSNFLPMLCRFDFETSYWLCADDYLLHRNSWSIPCTDLGSGASDLGSPDNLLSYYHSRVFDMRTAGQALIIPRSKHFSKHRVFDPIDLLDA
jgi:hypothetical protein